MSIVISGGVSGGRRGAGCLRPPKGARAEESRSAARGRGDALGFGGGGSGSGGGDEAGCRGSFYHGHETLVRVSTGLRSWTIVVVVSRIVVVFRVGRVIVVVIVVTTPKTEAPSLIVIDGGRALIIVQTLHGSARNGGFQRLRW